MESQGPLEAFFKSPDRKPDPKGDGILYHLRADLEKLYGREDALEGYPPVYSILAMTGVMVGIEYLSECYFSKKLSGTAFVESLIDLGGIDWDNAEALYQLRCALLHSFSLSVVSDRKSFRRGTRFSFKATDDSPSVPIRMESATESEVHYKVNVLGLKMCFARMIAELKRICLDKDHPRHSEVLERVCERATETVHKK